MTARLSAKQRQALQAAADGRVSYGDPHPRALRRRWERGRLRTHDASITDSTQVPNAQHMRSYAVTTWLLDGVEVYGQEKATYRSLSERELLEDWPNDDGTARVVGLTAAGRAALERS